MDVGSDSDIRALCSTPQYDISFEDGNWMELVLYRVQWQARRFELSGSAVRTLERWKNFIAWYKRNNLKAS
jgi:hypothetical protein